MCTCLVSTGEYLSGWLWREQTVRGRSRELWSCWKQHVLLGNFWHRIKASQWHCGGDWTVRILHRFRCTGTHPRLTGKTHISCLNFQDAQLSKYWMLEKSWQQKFTPSEEPKASLVAQKKRKVGPNNTKTPKRYTNLSPHWCGKHFYILPLHKPTQSYLTVRQTLLYGSF